MLGGGGKFTNFCSPSSFDECLQTDRQIATNPHTKSINSVLHTIITWAGNTLMYTAAIHHRHLLLLHMQANTLTENKIE